MLRRCVTMRALAEILTPKEFMPTMSVPGFESQRIL